MKSIISLVIICFLYIIKYNLGKATNREGKDGYISLLNLYTLVAAQSFLNMTALKRLLLVLYGLACSGALAAKDPVKLIIDTDAGLDVDDIGAITIANALQDNGEAEIIAISHTNAFVKGIGAVSTVMDFYGRTSATLGAYKGAWARDPSPKNGKGTADKYVSDLVGNFPSPIKNSSQVPTAVEAYRRALASSPDHSVHIASIGITTNMRDLVLSEGDSISPLNGHDLIALKVKQIVWMDGMYNFGCAEHDTYDWLGSDKGCRGSAKLAVENWPSSVKQIFSPVGADVKHGAWLNNCTGRDNPTRKAFNDWGVGNVGRSSWDPIAVLISVRGAENVFCKEVDADDGYMVVNETGAETWTHDGRPHNQSKIAYSADDPDIVISFLLNELLYKPIGVWSTTKWAHGRGENCWEGHGATEMESSPGSSCGIMSLEDCKQKCLGLDGCTGITVAPTSEEDEYFCYRRKDVVFGMCDFDTKFDTFVRKQWYPALGFNCYSGHGAIDIDGGKSCMVGSVEQCRTKCDETNGCTGIVFAAGNDSGVGECFRKGGNITLSECDRGTEKFDVYFKGL